MKPNVDLTKFSKDYAKHMHFIIDRYELPYEKRQWKKSQGMVINKIIDKNTINNNVELISFFIFLVCNSYILGPRIIREFFMHVYDQSPRYSEQGLIYWNELCGACKDVIQHSTVTYHDIIARKPITARNEVFEKGVKRIMEWKSNTNEIDDLLMLQFSKSK